jgi:acetyl esterase/lipase
MKKLLYTMALLMTVSIHLFAQPVTIQLWPDGAPNSNGLTGEENRLENGRVSNITQPTITVYPAAKPNGQAVIACPGGGYMRLAMNHEGHDMAAWFNAQGITLVVLKYRMPNGHYDVPLSDAEQAIRMVRQRAGEWKIDKNKVGIMGASAGGHLASTLATHYSGADTRPDFQILLYPVITMGGATHSGSHNLLLGENPTEELAARYSNDLQVTDKTPPAFITLSSDDRTVPPANSIGYYLALCQHHVPVALHAYPAGGHGWGFGDNFLYKRQWTEELEKWLRSL